MASVIARIVGIALCGCGGALAAWALVVALGWDGVPGALLALVVAMGVASGAWAGGTSLLRALRLIA